MKKKLTLKKRLIYLSITLLLCFLFLEIMMIVLEPYLFSGFFQYEPELGFQVRPGERGTNRFGFLDRDYPLERKPGTFRVLMLGDSYGWSCGREGNYTALLEQACSKYFGDDRIEVINTGYPMTHTAEQLAILKKYGLQYNPDLVVLGFFVGNDFIDAVPYRKRIVVNDTYIDIDKRNERILFGYPIVMQSRLFLFIGQKFKVVREFFKAGKESKKEGERSQKVSKGSILPITAGLLTLFQGRENPQEVAKKPSNTVEPFYSDETFMRIENDRLAFCSRKSQEAGHYDDRIEYILDSITEMQQLLSEKKIQFVVAIYPDEFQVNEALLEKILTRYELKREDFHLETMQDILKKHLDSLGVPWVDLLDEFREKGKDTQLYIIGDPHWNNAGNELAAAILMRELAEVIEIPTF